MNKTGEKLPSFFEIIEEGHEHRCRALWLGVILQQILDARGKFGNWLTKREAEIWLEGRGGIMSDFAEVCRLAGVDFDKTRRRCAEILANDSLSLDFRAMKQDKQDNRTEKNRRRYFRRAARNERLRIEKLQQVFFPKAENDNPSPHSNDNFIKPTTENKHDE